MATQYVNTVQQALIITYFKEKGALSEDKAIGVEALDWRGMGVQMVNPGKAIRIWYPFIKETDGKYWLDENRLELYYKRWRSNIIILIIFFVAIFIAMLILM